MTTPTLPIRNGPTLLVQAWRGVSLAQKMLFWGVAIVFAVMGVIMAITYVSAEEALSTQMERQVDNELRVVARLVDARTEALLAGERALARHRDLEGASAGPALAAELRDQGLSASLLLDRRGRPRAQAGAAAELDEALRAWAVGRTDQHTAVELLGTPPRLHVVAVTPLPDGGCVIAAQPFPLGLAGEVQKLLGGEAAVFVGDGVPATRYRAAGDGAALPATVATALSRGEPVHALAEFHHARLVTTYRPLRDHRGRVVAVLMRGVPHRVIEGLLQHHALAIFSMAGSAMLLAFLALIGLTQRLVRPIRLLAKASKSLAEGDFSEPIQLPRSRDEVGRLSAEFERIADQLVAAKDRTEAHNRELRGLLEKVFTAQEDERKRIARELHDQTGQALTSVLVGLKVLEGARSPEEVRERTVELKAIAVQTLEEVRALAVELRPSMLDDLGLVPSLRAYCKAFGAKHGVAIAFEARGLSEGGRLPALVEVAVYRIVQEALTNVAKYAQARHVSVQLVRRQGTLEATVADDGVGFDPDVVLRQGEDRRLGLLGMQERITLIGGAFSLKSVPGAGTTVSLLAPAPEGTSQLPVRLVEGLVP